MIVGSIKQCNHCGIESYIRTEVKNCPNCNEEFHTYPVNKAPAGWVKLEDHEISRRSVEKMLKSGDLTMDDLK